MASDLSQRFNVSEDTIRRDLKDLDSQGLLKEYTAALYVLVRQLPILTTEKL
ncbi:DeoR family transcriptional regulator [Enterococcus faecium]|nr:DeoR family transcriptional regulator [Enterococcus faecium]